MQSCGPRQESAAAGRSPAMESKAKRTLVKSAPELWELADDLARMEAWMAGLVGAGAPVAVEVTDREPERMLAWRATGDPPARTRGSRSSSPRAGSGPRVEITAQHSRAPGDVDRGAGALLDELGSPGRRPFAA